MPYSDLVSIIVPCYNEEKTIGLMLDAISQQTYPLSQIEVILADGMSSDNTLARIEEFALSHPELQIKVVENPKRIIPAGVNLAIESARGEYIIRMDAHSIPADNYVERCIANLKDERGDNVGGLWLIQPGAPNWIAKSIAIGAGHPLGAGDARYRYSMKAGEVDTVPFGAFHRSLFSRIGKFDESLKVNEDYEFNSRIRANGGKIFFDPSIRVQYFARPNLAALALQYWRYGYWKWRMLKRYPDTLRWRQALPPLLVLGTSVLLLLSIFFPLSRMILGVGILIYLFVLAAASIPYARQHRDARLLFGLPVAIGVMHFSWGSGFLWSILHPRA